MCDGCEPLRTEAAKRPHGSAEHWVVFMETLYGPALKARERLTTEGRWEACRDEMLALAERYNETPGGGLLMNAEYLLAVGRRPA